MIFDTTTTTKASRKAAEEVILVKGGVPLQGTVKAPGAKNAMTKLLVASLLSDQPCVFRNVPEIGDVEITVDLCKEIGMEVNWDKDAQVMEVVTKELRTSYIPQRFSGSNRIPILMIGALLGRCDEDIIVPTAGGCKIGKRPVNFHIEALEKLGATIEYRDMKKEGAYFASAYHGLQGALIELSYPSVGATENTILAAVRARGLTVLKNAALEPEVIDLILFLQKLGANITVDTDRTIKIQGTRKFYPVEHTVIPDRIVTASLAMAAVGTKGSVFVEGAEHQHLITFLNRLREIGGGFHVRENGIEFYYDGPLQGGIHIETDVYPGFSTDWQQPFVVLLTQAAGTSIIHETVYENRFGYAQTLKEMGGEIELFKQCLGGTSCRYAERNFYHSLLVQGPTKLLGGKICIPDLRAGFAYILAAMIADDDSEISGVSFLDRGYEKIVERLVSLGAQIERRFVEPRHTLQSASVVASEIAKAVSNTTKA